MDRQITGGKFGVEIPALTQARIKAEADSYSPQSRAAFHKALKSNSELMKQVASFLERSGAPTVSSCGADIFGVITSNDDPEAPCGITFYGSRSLALAVARAFPSNKVISANDGAPVAPVLRTVQLRVKTKPRP